MLSIPIPTTSVLLHTPSSPSKPEGLRSPRSMDKLRMTDPRSTVSVLAEPMLPPPNSWIAPRPINPRIRNVRRTSSLRVLAGNGAPGKTIRRSATRPPPARRDSAFAPAPAPPAEFSSSNTGAGLISYAGISTFVTPKLYLYPLNRMGGVVESPYFKYEVQLLHQLYFTGIIEEQVVRHVELLLSTSRPGAMHANLRAAFEWYQGHITRGIPEMVELARRVRVFASYNIYFCKLMGWTDMWLEVSSHTNLSTAQVTKNYCYNPNGVLPCYPPDHEDERNPESGEDIVMSDI